MQKKLVIFVISCLISYCSYGDTIGKYANIAQSIPEARLKADPQSQTWARSAKSILDVTEETIAQTLQAVQAIALKNKTPIFCLPTHKPLDNLLVHQILERAVSNLNSQDVNKTISEVVAMHLEADFPCQITAKQQSNEVSFGNNSYKIHSVRR